MRQSVTNETRFETFMIVPLRGAEMENGSTGNFLNAEVHPWERQNYGVISVYWGQDGADVEPLRVSRHEACFKRSSVGANRVLDVPQLILLSLFRWLIPSILHRHYLWLC